jgi:hypothetical protein
LLFKLLHRTIINFSLALITITCLFTIPAKAQYFDLKGNSRSASLRFRIIRNLVVIQLNINDKGPFNFILDTGVGMMVMTDPKMVDSIDLQTKRTIKLAGLGQGDEFEAYVTPSLKVDIPGLKSYDVSATILKTEHFNLSGFVGIPISGLLGYEFFSNLAVKLNFMDSTLTVYRPHDSRLYRKGTKIPITVEAHKPYMQTVVALPNGKMQQCKLVIDLGAGHPVSLENMIKKHGLPQKFIAANLGVGLAGPIYGFLSRIDEIDLGKYKIKDVITSFPNDYDSTTMKYMSVPRDGNLGIGLLKRFTVTFNYADNFIYLKPNALFKDPFEYDMSGIEYYAGGKDFKHIIISRVEPGSSADEIGLERGDEITAINFKPVANMTLEQIDALLKSRDQRNLLIEVYHDQKYDRVILTLKRRI